MSERRTILVTGGSAGIGAAIALQSARKGWRVAIGARGVERLEKVDRAIRDLGAEVHSGVLDVSDAESISRFFDAAEGALGPADVIVNNAAHSSPAPLHEQAAEGIASEIGANLLGAVLVTRRALQTLLGRGLRGDVVFMTSDAVKYPRPRQVVYGATKAALENLAEGLSRELEGSGVRVTTVRIGPTLSEFGAEWPMHDLMERTDYWLRFGLRDARLFGALLSAEDVARAVLHAVCQPPGVLMGAIEIQPEAPLSGDGG